MLTCLEGPALPWAALGPVPSCVESRDTDQVLGVTGEILQPDVRFWEKQNFHFFRVILAVDLPIVNLVQRERE